MKKKEVQALLAASMVAISLSLTGCTSKEEKHFLQLLNHGVGRRIESGGSGELFTA